MEKYIEIVQTETNKVVKRICVTNKSDRTIDKVIAGLNINLNHSKYYANINESLTKLPIGDFK